MKRLFRFLVLSTVAVAVLLVGTGVALAASVATSGMVVVRVQETGPDAVNLTIPVPALLVRGGVDLAALISRDELRDARRELEPWRGAVAELLEELDDSGDAVFVRVESRDETVSVSKDGRNLRVIVDAPDARVRVSIPTGLARHVFDAVAG